MLFHLFCSCFMSFHEVWWFDFFTKILLRVSVASVKGNFPPFSFLMDFWNPVWEYCLSFHVGSYIVANFLGPSSIGILCGSEAQAVMKSCPESPDFKTVLCTIRDSQPWTLGSVIHSQNNRFGDAQKSLSCFQFYVFHVFKSLKIRISRFHMSCYKGFYKLFLDVIYIQ